MSFLQGCLIYALLLFSAAPAYAQKPSMPEMSELEALVLTCINVKDGYEETICTVERFLDLNKMVKKQFKDDCRWAIWEKESMELCEQKAQYEGFGTFFTRRTAYCRITQTLLFYGELLERELGGGQRMIDERLMDLNVDPDSPTIFSLQKLREKILDPNSKKIKCEQRPMV